MRPLTLGSAAFLALVSSTQLWTGVGAQPGWGWEAQCIGQWLQCGGLNYWGPTNCCEGHQCEFVNDYWWQCNPTEAAPVKPVAPAGPVAPVVRPTTPSVPTTPVSPPPTVAPVTPATPAVVPPATPVAPVAAPDTPAVATPPAAPATVPDAPAVAAPDAPVAPPETPAVVTPPDAAPVAAPDVPAVAPPVDPAVPVAPPAVVTPPDAAPVAAPDAPAVPAPVDSAAPVAPPAETPAVVTPPEPAPTVAPDAPLTVPEPAPVAAPDAPVPPPVDTTTPVAPPPPPAVPDVPASAPTVAPTHRPHHWGHHHHPSPTDDATTPAGSLVPTVAPTPFPTEAGPPFWEQECFRVRKNILSLTPEELADFLEALQTLKSNGMYDTITSVHGNPTTFNLFHGNDYFLPWHRWYVLRIESAVRDLGGKFACFSMPYWDWTLDAGREAQSPIWDIFGPMGKKNDSFCMREGPFAEWKNSKGGCLKRIGSDSYRFFSPAEVLDLIMGKEELVGGFRPAFEAGAHSRPHLFIGGAMNSFASPDDPIFWLHHAFVDKVWTMWQDCHNILDPADITATDFKPDQVDVELAYAPGVTARSMWSTRNLGYTYETDIMSAYTFLNTCHWSSIKPNPGLDLNLPSPPMPDLPPETRQGGPPPPPADAAAAPPAPVDPAAAAAPAQPQKQQMDSSKTPNLRGKQTVVALPQVQQPQNSSSALALTPAQGGFVATKEWAAAQAAVAPFEPHGKGLIVEENRVFTACMARVQRGEKGATRAECRKEVLKRDCELLGFICDLPETYRDGMHMAADEDVFKQDSVCARSCQRRL